MTGADQQHAAWQGVEAIGFAGLPLIMTEAKDRGGSHFRRMRRGIDRAAAGRAAIGGCSEHVFMIATNQVAYDWFQSGIWFTTQNGKTARRHYPIGMFMDRVRGGRGSGFAIAARQRECICAESGGGAKAL